MENQAMGGLLPNRIDERHVTIGDVPVCSARGAGHGLYECSSDKASTIGLIVCSSLRAGAGGVIKVVPGPCPLATGGEGR